MRRREYVDVNTLADTDRVYEPANWRFPESGDVVRFVDSVGRHRFHQIMDRFAAGDRFWFQGVLYAAFADAQSPSGLAYQPAGRVLDVDGQAVSTAAYVARYGGDDAIAQAQDPTQPGYNPAVASVVAASASGAPEQLGLLPRLETSQAVAVAAPSVAPAIAAAPAAGSGLPTDYLFTGQKWDSATGLYKMDDRYYDPTLGRFISPDSYIPDLTNPQDLNRYSYARNNPLKYSDPTGHFPYTPLPFPDFWLPQAGQALNQLWMRAQPYAYQLAADLSQFAASPQAALALQNAQQMQAHASQMQQAASQAGNTGDPGQFDPNKWDPKKTVDAAKDVAQTLKKYSLDSGDCSKAADKVYTTLTKSGYQAERVKWSYTATTEPNRMILADGRVVSSTRGVTYAYHEFVRVGDRVFDAITGPEGMLWKDYLSQWDPYTLHWIVETVASAP
jgi:RHS repeat-associated protein